MKKIGQYAVQYKIAVQQSFELEKVRTESTSISKESFQKVLRQKYGNVGQTLTQDLLDFLVLYLQEEEIGAVNLVRIGHAVNSREPLAQAGLKHLERQTSLIDEKKALPLEIVQLLHALRSS